MMLLITLIPGILFELGLQQFVESICYTASYLFLALDYDYGLV